MKTETVFSLKCAVIVAGALAYSASAVAQSHVSTGVTMDLGGSPCGAMRSVEGGSISADVINEPSGPSYFIKKHLGQPRNEDFAVQFGFSQGRALYEWIASSWKASFERKNVTLIGGGQMATANQCLITETTVPGLSAASKQPGYLEIKFACEQISRGPSKAEGKLPEGVQDRLWLASGFRFQLNGMKPSNILGIDSFKVKQTMVADNIGDARDYAKEPGKLEFPNLKVTVARSSARPWIEWHKDFLINGNNDESREKSGTLTLVGADGKELATINLFNVGVFKITDVDAGNPNGPLIVELYVERMEFKMVAN